MNDDDFEIFAEGEETRPGNLNEVMAMIRHYVDERHMPVETGLDILFDLVRPGNSANSHDVRQIFVGAMYAREMGHLCPKFESLYITTMPWGFGFVIAVEPGWKFDALPRTEQHAITASLCNVLQAGGMNAHLNGDDKIVVVEPGGETTEMDIDDIVAGFRIEIERELGNDEGDDPMKRWMP